MTTENKTDDILTANANPAPSPQGTRRLEDQVIVDAWVPGSYEIWGDGVYKRKVFTVSAEEGEPPKPNLYEPAPQQHARARLEKVSGRPAYLSAIGHRVDDDRELVGLTYLHSHEPEDTLRSETERAQHIRDGGRIAGPRWETLWVSYDQVADQRKLLDLSVDVFPVNSNNVRNMVSFLTDSYDVNVATSTRATIVRRMGHHFVDGKHGWLVGQRWIGPGRVMADPNQDKLSKAVRTHGDEQEWIRFTREQWDVSPDSWIVRWLLATSFTSPLLRFIGERTFFVHHYAQSGGAKSTCAFLGQSVYGHPREFSMALNRATQNSLTEVFKYMSDLPLLLDEMQGKQIDASDFVMQACTEEHKARVRQEGGLHAVEAKMWRLLLRTTGEQTLAGADKEDLGGQANRSLEIRHNRLPLEQGKHIYRKFIEPARHYGYAGIRFLTKLAEVVNDHDRVRRLVERYEEYVESISKFTGQSRAVERQLGAVMLGEFLMLRWVYDMDERDAVSIAYRDACDIAANWLRVRDSSATPSSKAAEFLVEHRHSFAHMYADASTDVGKGKLASLGSRTSMPLIAAYNAGPKSDEIWYFPSAVNRLLSDKFRAPPDRIWEEFADQGVLDRNKDRLVRKRQIKDILSSVAVYVVRADRLFAYEAEPVLIDVSELSSYIHHDDAFFDDE